MHNILLLTIRIVSFKHNKPSKHKHTIIIDIMLFFLATLLLSSLVAAQNRDAQPHYLVGLLNYPNSFIPDELKGVSSGTYIPVGDEVWVSAPNVPYSDVPGVGFSDMEFYYDEEGNKVTGQFFCLSE